MFFSSHGNSSLFCGLANLDEDTVKTKAYQLVEKREKVLIKRRRMLWFMRYEPVVRYIKRERFKSAAKMQHYERLIKSGGHNVRRKGRRQNSR